MWAGSRFLPEVCGLAVSFYLEYVDGQQGFYLEFVGWQQVSTWSMWAASRFLPGVCGLAAGLYLEYVGWQQVCTWSMWAGSRFLPEVCGLAAGFYLEYVGWQQGFYLEYVGWQLCSSSGKDILQIIIEALSHLAVLDLTHPVNPSYSSLQRLSHKIINN
jgi:hypothetical protein